MRISDWSSDVCSSDLLDTVQAAVLLAKMAIFEEEIDLRQRVADGYAAEFARAGLDLAPKVREGNTSVWAQYTVRVPKRADVQATLSAASIPSFVYFTAPLNRPPPVAHTPEGMRVGDPATGA